jgi:hypothetical protein
MLTLLLCILLLFTTSNVYVYADAATTATATAINLSFEEHRYQYNLPVIPIQIQNIIKNKINIKNENNKYIPSIAWIATRNNSEARPSHMTGSNGFIARNKNWQIHFCDNNDKDHFMETNYYNSSILWAYNVLNPVIGNNSISRRFMIIIITIIHIIFKLS